MNPKRFTGNNARNVLKQVRAELGPDAIILSNRSVDGGVEILAISPDSMVELVSGEDRGAPPAAAAAPAPAARPARGDTQSFLAHLESKGKLAATRPAAPAPVAAAAIPAQAKAAPDSALMEELKSLKGMLREQLADLAWHDTLNKRPLRGTLLRKLLGAGFSALLSRTLVERLPEGLSSAEAGKWLLDVLARNIRVAPAQRDIVDQGGVVALVGPTGVGKTTTAAKLAARCVMKFGAGGLGLITTDGYRIGAQDQLRIYGRILGVPVMVAQDSTELSQALAALQGKHLVLVDTTGMGQRDARVAEQHRMLVESGARRLLLLNATTQAETLDEVVRAYQPADARPLDGVVLTKSDETARIGCALDVIVRRRLTLHYVTSGQRVPEDIHAASATVLAHRALKEAGDQAFALNDEEAGLVFTDGIARMAGAR
jgi:flagellar biosynthesis protein FlhF